MKIVKIGAITLDEGMWVEESKDSNGVVTEVVNNLDGGIIVFEQIKRVSRKEVTLKSLSYAWQLEVTVDALVALANLSIGQAIIVEDSDGNTFNVRFRHEVKGGAVQFTRKVEARLSEWYTGTIYMARV